MIERRLKKRRFAIAGTSVILTIGIALFAVNGLRSKSDPLAANQSSNPASSGQGSNSTASGGNRSPAAVPSPGAPGAFTKSLKSDDPLDQKFLAFQNKHPRLSVPLDKVANDWEPMTSSKKRFLQWVGAAMAVEDDAAYADLMLSMQKTIAQESEDILQLLNDPKIRATLDENPFLRQMAINIIDKLSVSDSEKEQLYGQEIARPITFEKDGSISFDSANITNAMIFYSQKVKDKAALNEIISKGLELNSKPAARQAYLARVQAYFPQFEAH